MLTTYPSDVTRFAHQLVARYGDRAVEIARENTNIPADIRSQDMAFLVLNEVEQIMGDRDFFRG